MASKPCITIIGTGLIGCSIGMALRKARNTELEIVGHDRNPEQAGLARRIGAVDKIERNLISACSQADMIVLTIPASGIRETLEIVAQDLKSGCVITDTASVKVQVLEWADSILPPTVSFVGGDPILFGDEAGIDSASDTLFKGKLYCLVPSAKASGEAVKLVTDMVALLGAVPHYIDPYEHDGMIGGTEHLADIMAVTLLGALSASGGWRDMRRLCGATFDRVTCFSVDDAQEYRDRALLNRENVLRWMDTLQDEISRFRGLIQRQDQAGIEAYYTRQMQERRQWLQDQATQNWDQAPSQEKLPTAGQMFGDMFFGGWIRKRTER